MDRTGLEMRAVNRLKRVATEKKAAKKKKSPEAPKSKPADVKSNTEAAMESSKKLNKLVASNTFERMGRLLMKMKADGNF